MPHAQSDAAQHKLSARILCLVVGFSLFKSFNPLLSYGVPYLVEDKGLTNFEVTNKVLPIISYGALISTVLAAPACEYLSYWTVIYICNFVLLTGSLIMRFGSGLVMMQIMEVLASLGDASYSVFQAYIFLFATSNDFQYLTGINQGSTSASLFLSAELGQILVSCGISYNILSDIYIAATITTCILGFLLPKDHREEEETRTVLLNFFSRDQGFWSTVKDTWKDQHLQILSIWWATSVAGFGISLNYGTNLFEEISSNTTYNGQVLAVGTACGSLTALSSLYLRKLLTKTGDAVYIMGSAVYGVLCLTMALSKSLWTAYLAYIAMVALEKLMICLVYAQCASLVRNERYILLFSFNTGIALLLMAIIQMIFEIIGLDVFSQYVTVGGYFIVITVMFTVLYGIYLWHSYTMGPVSASDTSSAETAPGAGILSLNEPLIQNLDTTK